MIKNKIKIPALKVTPKANRDKVDDREDDLLSTEYRNVRSIETLGALFCTIAFMLIALVSVIRDHCNDSFFFTLFCAYFY